MPNFTHERHVDIASGLRELGNSTGALTLID
jgi:hypothetical protein